MKEIYTEDTIKTLDWKTHIRKRPGMYIGKLGDGSSQDDGIYVLIKEVLDNSIDEFVVGNGKKIDIKIKGNKVKIRDYGRGIPLSKVVDVSSKMNTGAKYDSKVFKKSVGLNGVGIKAVNAMSDFFEIKSFRGKKIKKIIYSRGIIKENYEIIDTNENNGVEISFIPDKTLFVDYKFIIEYIEIMIKNYTFLNTDLSIYFNNKKFFSKNGLRDLLNENMNSSGNYPIIHLKAKDIEIAFTHGKQYGEEHYSFVNGQHTTQGGTHLLAFREAIVKTIREFYKKDFDNSDVRTSIIGAISLRVEEPVFESQTKIKLSSKYIDKNKTKIRNFVIDFFKKELDNFLHRNPETAKILLNKIIESEKERKAISGIKKLARERAKKTSLHNKKLRDCRINFNSKHKNRDESTIFITEGDSASGSITKSRDVNTQAVFSLKGKPLNTYGLTKRVVYENQEFNLLQAALNIEENIENLRYNKIIIATDADVDGMHIRLLLITFFLKFFPELIQRKHLYILQTPLFRVRNKKETFYCYDEEEKQKAIKKVKKNPEITRFKGLGEISPKEFKYFIGENMRLENVKMKKEDIISDLLDFYMGKNTPKRQEFIITNLRTE